MKTRTSSLMDGKDYQQRNFVFSDDHIVNTSKMVDQVTGVEKLAEEHQQGGYEWQNEKRKSFIAGYNKAKETLYTEEQVREAMEFARGHNKMTDTQFIKQFKTK